MTIFRYFKFLLLFKSFGLKWVVFLTDWAGEGGPECASDPAGGTTGGSWRRCREPGEITILITHLEEAEGGAESRVLSVRILRLEEYEGDPYS
jgi:hypothetical protein